MTIEYEIEYIKLPNGEYKFENITSYDYHFNSYNILNVEFEGYPTWQNDGIGGYEYWGQVGYDEGVNYCSLEEHGKPTWDTTLYTEDENEIIIQFLQSDSYTKLEDEFCKRLKIVQANNY